MSTFLAFSHRYPALFIVALIAHLARLTWLWVLRPLDMATSQVGYDTVTPVVRADELGESQV